MQAVLGSVLCSAAAVPVAQCVPSAMLLTSATLYNSAVAVVPSFGHLPAPPIPALLSLTPNLTLPAPHRRLYSLAAAGRRPVASQARQAAASGRGCATAGSVCWAAPLCSSPPPLPAHTLHADTTLLQKRH